MTDDAPNESRVAVISVWFPCWRCLPSAATTCGWDDVSSIYGSVCASVHVCACVRNRGRTCQHPVRCIFTPDTCSLVRGTLLPWQPEPSVSGTLSLILSESQILPLSLPVSPSSDCARLPPSPLELLFHWCVSTEQITADRVINYNQQYVLSPRARDSSEFGNIFLHISSIIQYFFNKVQKVWLHYVLFKLCEYIFLTSTNF